MANLFNWHRIWQIMADYISSVAQQNLCSNGQGMEKFVSGKKCFEERSFIHILESLFFFFFSPFFFFFKISESDIIWRWTENPLLLAFTGGFGRCGSRKVDNASSSRSVSASPAASSDFEASYVTHERMGECQKERFVVFGVECHASQRF